ncbi:hypothetical protein T439DRAFT_199691 [Meredithblackwellia eburnea MCA 4105]
MASVAVTLDDFSTIFAYSGLWTAPDTSTTNFPGSDSFLLSLVDGTYHRTSSVNSSVSLNFTGLSISLYGVAGPNAGYYDVTLDGASATSAPVNAYSPTNSSNHLLFSKTGLSSGQHSITLTNRGSNGNSTMGSELWLDYGQVLTTVSATESSVTNTTVDDSDHSRLVYSGAWTVNTNSGFLGNTSTYTNQDGGSVSLTFAGSVVYVYGDTVDDHGAFSIKLDNKTYNYNGYTSHLKIGTLMFFAGGLSPGNHTITLINGAGGTYVDLDYIRYTTPAVYASSPSSTSAGGGASSSASAPMFSFSEHVLLKFDLDTYVVPDRETASLSRILYPLYTIKI